MVSIFNPSTNKHPLEKSVEKLPSVVDKLAARLSAISNQQRRLLISTTSLKPKAQHINEEIHVSKYLVNPY